MATSIIRLTLDSVTFDAATITFDAANAITQHPIELGATVSDHSQALPSTITISAVVSESPYADQTNGVPFLRRANALLFLESARGELVTVSTDQYGVFTNYMLVRWRHGLDNVRRALIIIELQQIRQAAAGFVTIPVSAPSSASVSAGFATASSAGQQATTSAAAASSAAAAADVSWLKGLLGRQ